MDISFLTGAQKFNYRVCAMILHENKILAMRDERSPYYYLPGGRVKMGETAEQAVIREVEEELNIKARILRPLWLNQAFSPRMWTSLIIMSFAFISSWMFLTRTCSKGASGSHYRNISIYMRLNGWHLNDLTGNTFIRCS